VQVAEKEAGATKKRIQERAAYWYKQALPQLAGLEKDRVEKRVYGGGSIAGGGTPAASAIAGTAIGQGLEWLIRQQNSDGHWTFAPGQTQAASPTVPVAQPASPLFRCCAPEMPINKANAGMRSKGDWRS